MHDAVRRSTARLVNLPVDCPSQAHGSGAKEKGAACAYGLQHALLRDGSQCSAAALLIVLLWACCQGFSQAGIYAAHRALLKVFDNPRPRKFAASPATAAAARQCSGIGGVNAPRNILWLAQHWHARAGKKVLPSYTGTADSAFGICGGGGTGKLSAKIVCGSWLPTLACPVLGACSTAQMW